MKLLSFYKAVVIIIAILYLSAQTSSASEIYPFQELVRKSFADDGTGPGFFMQSKAGNNHVEVCGDHCSYFEWKGNINDEKYWKFIVLFELTDEPGVDVAAFQRNVKAIKGQELIERKYCSIKGVDLDAISCDWKSYSKSLKIRVGHSNYDEGGRCYWTIIESGKIVSSKQKCSPIKPEESPWQK